MKPFEKFSHLLAILTPVSMRYQEPSKCFNRMIINLPSDFANEKLGYIAALPLQEYLVKIVDTWIEVHDYALRAIHTKRSKGSKLDISPTSLQLIDKYMAAWMENFLALNRNDQHAFIIEAFERYNNAKLQIADAKPTPHKTPEPAASPRVVSRAVPRELKELYERRGAIKANLRYATGDDKLEVSEKLEAVDRDIESIEREH